MSQFVVISTSLCLLSLAACSTGRALHEPPRVEIRQIRVLPPESLIQPCEVPRVNPVVVNRDLVEALHAQRTALHQCARKIDRIRQWVGEGSPDSIEEP